MVRLTKITGTVSTTLLVASVTSAIWPAFPSNMGAAAGSGSTRSETSTRSSVADWEDYTSQKRRLHQAGYAANESCTCRSELLAVEAKCRENEEKIETLQSEVHSFSSKLNSLKNSVGTVRDGRHASPQRQAYNIAFSARVGYNRPYLRETEIVVFDELVINNGDVYDPYSGKFTSPVPGVYHFQTSILSGFNTTIETMIVLNGKEVTRVFSGGFNNRGSGSNSVVLNMVPGDEVWVSVFFGNGDYVHGLWSTFSGFLVNSLI